MKLYDYYRSSCSYRVRIALNVKNLSYDIIPVHLVNNGGEQHFASYKKINPQEIVPSLETSDGIINQSLAIIEYLEDVYPTPALLPKDPFAKSLIRSIALLIACEIHPLNNLRVLQTLENDLHINKEQKLAWYHKWLKLGFSALESKLSNINRNKNVCYGDCITMADIFLIPQVYNAKRFEFPMEDYPIINSINEYCLNLPAFKKAEPNQI